MPITFSCSCGKKLQVNDEFAGRRAKCSACGTIQAVPKPVAAQVVEVNAFEVVEDEPDGETFQLADPGPRKADPPDDDAVPPRKKKRKNIRTKDEVDDGSLAAPYLADACETAAREEERARQQGNDGGGWTMFGVTLTAGVLGGSGMLLSGAIAMIAMAFFRDDMGPKTQGKAFVGAIVYTAIGLITLFRALMGEEE